MVMNSPHARQSHGHSFLDDDAAHARTTRDMARDSVGSPTSNDEEVSDSAAQHSGDLQFMQRVTAGDDEAKVELVTRLAGRIGRLCGGMFRGNADLKDLVQTCLLEILESAPNYSGTGSLERWADRIAIRRSMKVVVRARAVESKYEHEIEPDEVLTAQPGSTEALPRALEQYMKALPTELSTLLMMKHVYGYTVREISDLTDTSSNTIKKRLTRANQSVRRLIQRDRLIEETPRGIK